EEEDGEERGDAEDDQGTAVEQHAGHGRLGGEAAEAHVVAVLAAVEVMAGGALVFGGFVAELALGVGHDVRVERAASSSQRWARELPAASGQRRVAIHGGWCVPGGGLAVWDVNRGGMRPGTAAAPFSSWRGCRGGGCGRG